MLKKKLTQVIAVATIAAGSMAKRLVQALGSAAACVAKERRRWSLRQPF